MTISTTPRAEPSFHVLHTDRNLVVGACGHVHMVLYRGDITSVPQVLHAMTSLEAA